MCAITGIPAPTIAAMRSARSTPPSSFTDDAPARTSRPALRIASSFDGSYAMNGKSIETCAFSVPRTTAAPWRSISSIDTDTVDA